MPELMYTEGFIEDIVQVELESKRKEIFGITDLLSDFPELGSNNLPASIFDCYGGSVRKLAVRPFFIIYEYRESEDAVYLLGLDHQRAAW
mgnify:CR=1 FL=1